MQKKNYLQAIDYYTQALELTKANKYLWTNRALAHIKREDYESAIDDCSKILEYCDVLEDGYTKSRDAAFKAFSRRAMAYKGKEQFEEALKDVRQAKILYPEDESISIFEKDLITLEEQKVKIKAMEESLNTQQEDKLKLIDDFKSSLSQHQKKIFSELYFILGIKDLKEITDDIRIKCAEYDYTLVSEIGKPENEKLALFFYTQGGFESIKRIFKLKAYNLTFRNDKTNFNIFIHSLMNEKNQNLQVYQEAFVKNNFARVIIKRINAHLVELFSNGNVDQLESDQKKEPVSEEEYTRRMQEIEDFTEVLVCLSENRSNRLYFREKGHLLNPIFNLFYQNVI